MLYALLCYNSEEMVTAWTAEEDAKVMAALDVVHQELAAAGKLGPAARLTGTKVGKTLWKGSNLVTDGPYAETKEQMLGFYLVDVADMDEALEIARRLGEVNPGPGGYEVRPLSLFVPGAWVEPAQAHEPAPAE